MKVLISSESPCLGCEPSLVLVCWQPSLCEASRRLLLPRRPRRHRRRPPPPPPPPPHPPLHPPPPHPRRPRRHRRRESPAIIRFVNHRQTGRLLMIKARLFAGIAALTRYMRLLPPQARR